MRALLINAVCGIKSTGRICTDIARKLENSGYEVKIAYGRDDVPEQYRQYAIRIGSNIDVCWHALMTRVFDDRGFWSKRATRRFLEWADDYNPELLWLHNLHDYYINIEMLFEWIKKRPQMKVRWTQHDCWAFTGHCAHFTFSNCEQWKTNCFKCNQTDSFMKNSLVKHCKRNFEKKKKIFSGVENLTLITPSQWLANIISQSFLKNYPVEIINNEIDKTIFKPTSSNFREKYGLENKKIILGVASSWTKGKGMDDFIKLSQMLNDNYVIVLVGLSNKQIKQLPKRIIGIRKTNSVQELCGMYTAADVFVNPSKEETFGMTTIEATACGTPAIVYKRTACEEVVNKFGGIAVDANIDDLHGAIIEQVGGGTIIAMSRTNSPTELAQIYTAADLFFNPTYEDTYPTVNLEAKACGTPIVTYCTGGSPESAGVDSVIVPKGDLGAVIKAVRKICASKS